MTHDEATDRLAQCRALQPDAMQVIVAADIVDALLEQHGCGCSDCPTVITLRAELTQTRTTT